MKLLNQKGVQFLSSVPWLVKSYCLQSSVLVSLSMLAANAFADEPPNFEYDNPAYDSGATKDGVGGSLIRQVGFTTRQGGRIVLLAISVLAFIWIAYSAVAKFRDCQKGLADWSELIVLGVAAGGILIFVTILLTNAAEPLEAS